VTVGPRAAHKLEFRHVLDWKRLRKVWATVVRHLGWQIENSAAAFVFNVRKIGADGLSVKVWRRIYKVSEVLMKMNSPALQASSSLAVVSFERFLTMRISYRAGLRIGRYGRVK
jgi:hypothetical protein